MGERGLTWHGRRVLTIPQAAQRYGLTVNAMRKALARLDIVPVAPAPIDERTPVYYAVDLDWAMRTGRPGRGANLRRR